MPPPDFVPRRFRSTVPFYTRYRLAYPAQLVARVIQWTELAPGSRVLDLGCGPGFVAIPFAQAGMNVIGVDPEPDMLDAARAAAEAAGVAIDFRLGSSFALPDTGLLDLVTMGRSFHWMDRAETLRALDGLLVGGGAIALFEDEHPRTAENSWIDALRDVGKRYGAHEAAHRVAAARSDYRTHVSHLFDSPFSRIERVGVFVRRELSADEIIGRAFSLSMLSPEQLGERASAFEADLRTVLATISADGRFTEIAELAAIIAMRR